MFTLINKLIILLIILTLAVANTQADDTSNEIVTKQLFLGNIPKQMIVGEAYNIDVFVQNNLDIDSNFQVMLFLPSTYFYPTNAIQTIKLNKGETRKIEFSITPIKKHTGIQTIKAVLFSVNKKNTPSELGFISTNSTNNSTNEVFQTKELDEVETEIFSIKQKFDIEYIYQIIIVTLLVFVLYWAIRKKLGTF